MFRRLRAWWASQKCPYRSPEYNAAMDVLEPGYLARMAEEDARYEQRNRRERDWFDSLVALQQAGRVDDAAKQAEADMNGGRIDFVLEPMERIAHLYALDVDRLLALGDIGGARRASGEADRYMAIWASWSTSGGEGTARSRARDELRRELDARIAGHATTAPGGGSARTDP
jgi:hypothetical protein